MIKICYKCRGAISVFLVLIMLPMFVCAGLCVDGSRAMVAKSSVSGAGDLAMNAALSEYDSELQDIYGLFAISENMDELQENVSRYFTNTVNNSSVMQGTDSYTRTFVDSLVASIFSGEDVEFSNVIDLQVEEDTFKLTGQSDSVIARPEVLERQIVEYMKYRAPINLASGMLTKISCLGDMSGQTKAINKKLEYEEKLEDVAKACEKAYKKIKEYNEKVRDTYSGKIGDVQLTGENINAAYSDSMSSAYNHYTSMTEYIIAVNSSDYDVEDIDDATVSITYTDDATVQDKLGKVEEKLSEYIKFKRNSSDQIVQDTTDWANALDDMDDGAGDDFGEQKNYVADVKAYTQSDGAFYKMYALIKKYQSLYNQFKNETDYDDRSTEEKEDYSRKNSILGDIKGQIDTIIEYAQGYPDTWKSHANDEGAAAYSDLHSWNDGIEDITNALEEAGSALNKVKEKLEGDIKTTKEEWKSSIANLKAGTVRASMQGDYDSSAQNIKTEQVDVLIKVLTKNKDYFNSLRNSVAENKYYDNKVDNTGDYYNRFQDYIGLDGSVPSCMSHYQKGALPETPTVTEQLENGSNNVIGIGQIDKGAFFEYLEKTYGGFEEESNKEKKAEAKKTRKAFIDKGEPEKEVNTSTVTTGAVNTTELTEALQNVDSESGNSDNTEKIDMSDDDDNKKMSDSCQKSLSSVSTMFERLMEILEKGRDNLYLEEYITEMFSCYTSGKSANGEDTEPAISSVNKSNILSNHKFYRSEIEYILFGGSDTKDSLVRAKAMIFAVRLALNSVYAFTDNTIRLYTLQTATAIAGWTGFGVPIVQSVLTFAMAMAESVIDVRDLCSGKSVALMKSKDTWKLSPDALLGKTAEQIGEYAESAFNSVMDDVFTQIEDISYENIDNVTDIVNQYTKETTKKTKETIQATILVPLQTNILNMIGASYEPSEETISNKIDEVLSSICMDLENTGVVGTATQIAVEYVRNNCKPQIAAFVLEKYQQYQSQGQSAVSDITKKLEELLNNIGQQIDNKVATTLDEANSALKTEVSSVLNSADEKVKAAAKEKINSAITSYTDKLSGASTYDNDIKLDTTKDKSSFGSSITMSYQEYMKVFTLLFLIGNREAMLSRTAQMIHLNIRECAGKEDFNLAKSYTMVQISADVAVRTSFLEVVTPTGLDYSKIGTGRRKISYLGTIGY